MTGRRAASDPESRRDRVAPRGGGGGAEGGSARAYRRMGLADEAVAQTWTDEQRLDYGRRHALGRIARGHRLDQRLSRTTVGSGVRHPLAWRTLAPTPPRGPLSQQPRSIGVFALPTNSGGRSRRGHTCPCAPTETLRAGSGSTACGRWRSRPLRARPPRPTDKRQLTPLISISSRRIACTVERISCK